MLHLLHNQAENQGFLNGLSYSVVRLPRLETHPYTICEVKNSLFEQLLNANLKPIPVEKVRMSFGFGVGHIIVVSKLAHNIWAKVRDPSNHFNANRSERVSIKIL